MFGIQGILKKKARALAIFEKTKIALMDVITRLEKEIEESNLKIDDLVLLKKEQEDNIELAHSEIQSSRKTIEQINSILGA